MEVPSIMLTEKSLRGNPVLIKAFTGLPANTFWELVLLPLIRRLLPAPKAWTVVEEGETLGQAEVLELAQLADKRALVDATEQPVYRSQDNEVRKAYYSGKKKAFTLKTQFVTDGEHHIVAISEAVPGAKYDKKLSDEVKTVERLPDGCETNAAKGYQGLADQVTLVTVRNAETGEEQQVPCLTVHTPIRKPKGQELIDEQKAFNHQLGAIRVRVEHCIGWAKNWAIIATLSFGEPNQGLASWAIKPWW
jgi:hypothetical protein